MSKKYEHGYLPKIQYHALKVVQSSNNLMEPGFPDAFKGPELEAFNKSLDSLIHFAFKWKEQYKTPEVVFEHRPK